MTPMLQEERRTHRIAADELLDLGDYERQRDAVRARAIAARALRRIELGPNATIAFENRETVLYQIQEILRAERIARPEEVALEAENYSDLLPSDDELSATLMFEFPEAEGRDLKLRDLAGFEDHLALHIDGAGVAKAFFDRRQIDPDRISAVQFVRFALNDAQRNALARGARVRAVADRARYAHEVELPPETVRALAGDLNAL